MLLKFSVSSAVKIVELGTYIGSNPAGRAIASSSIYGDCSSVGRALDCDSGGRGFEPRQSPHYLKSPLLYFLFNAFLNCFFTYTFYRIVFLSIYSSGNSTVNLEPSPLVLST